MMKNGSGHDRPRRPEREFFVLAPKQPGWLARAWAATPRAWRWIRRKHEPISEGIETAGRGWTRAARTAARVGRSLAKMGAVIERNGTILAKGRGRARRLGRNLVSFGRWLRKFGEWLTKTGRSWAPIGESIEDIGEHLGELDISPLPSEEETKSLSEPEPPPALPAPRPEPEPTPPPAPGVRRKHIPLIKDKIASTARRGQRRKTAGQPVSSLNAGPELPADVQAAIAGLGKRPRSEHLRDMIEMVCRSREWTTVKELSGFLGVSEKTLRSRHLPAMIQRGRLVRRYPDRRRHRRQAYAVPQSSSLATEPLHQIHNGIRS